MSNTPENVPPFLAPIYHNDPLLFETVMKNMGEFLPENGSIPLKYRLLMSMVADGVLFHPTGVTALAQQARDAGATQDEINEAMRIIFLSGGMVALINSMGVYKE